jgi:uncharacterized protein
MAVRLVALAFGAVFGFAISWGQFTDPDRIRDMLLLEDAYLYLMIAVAVAVGFVGTRLARGRQALVTRTPVSWTTARPQRRHFTGAAIFGVGWAVTDSCPGPIVGQLASGIGWSILTFLGVIAGIALYFRRQERAAEAPAGEVVAP